MTGVIVILFLIDGNSLMLWWSQPACRGTVGQDVTCNAPGSNILLWEIYHIILRVNRYNIKKGIQREAVDLIKFSLIKS